MSIRKRITTLLSKQSPISSSKTRLIGSGKTSELESKKSFFSILEERIQTTVDKASLEKLYHIDGYTFRLVQDHVDWIVGPGYYLEGDTEDKVFLEWCNRMHLTRILKEIIKDIFVTGAGNAWVELGYSEDGKDILGLRMINPKTDMDYIRDASTKNVLLDDTGRPIGFVQNQGLYGKVEWRKDRIVVNDKIVWTPKWNGDDGRDRIAHFTLFRLGESYLGMTPLESAYKQAIIRLNIEENVGESAFRSGGILATVGTPDKPPESIPDKWVDDVVKELENVTHKTIFGFKPNVRIDRFPSPELERRAELIYTFADLQAAAMGRPLILLLHSTTRRGYGGEAEHKAIDWELRIASLQQDLASQIEEKLLARYAKCKNIKEVPKFRFRTKTPVILRDRARAIATLARRNMIRYDPLIAKQFLEEFGLPTEFIEKEIEKWKEENRTPEATKEVDIRDRAEEKTKETYELDELEH